MSYQEKRALVSIFSTLLITVMYSAFMLQRYPQADAYAPEVFHFWGLFFMILIPVSIVTKILITIVFSIFNTIVAQEGEPSITDERDRLIELKSIRNAIYVLSIGIMLAMGSLVFDQPPSVMFIMLIGAGVLSDITSDVSQFYFYRRGF